MRVGFERLLVCVSCRGPLSLECDERDGDTVISGTLRCTCGRAVPIRRGVPRFVDDDAYVDTFSFQWNKHRLTQLDTVSRHESDETFRLSTGLSPDDLNGKLVLDVGCGMGRFSDVAERAGATVVGIDLSFAIDAAHRNLGTRPRVHLAQADVFALPFAPGTFDVIFSIGVLHHTPDCRLAVTTLMPLLKPHGILAVWLYPKYKLSNLFEYDPGRWSSESPYVLRAPIRLGPVGIRVFSRLARVIDSVNNAGNELARAVGRRLPQRLLYALCHAAIPLYHVLKLKPFAPLRLFIKISMHPDPQWRVLDTFDNLSPRYQSRHTYEEVEGWFRSRGFTDITRHPNFVGVSGCAPEAPSR